MRITTVLAKHIIQLQADGRSVYWREQIDRHVRFMDRWLAAHRLPRDVRRITHEHIARFLASPEANTRLDGRPKKATSTNCLRTSVKVYFAFTHAAGFAPRNAGALIRRARCAPPPPRAIPADDLRRLLATVDAAEGWAAERDSALLHLLVETGARVGSILAADVEHLDLPHGELHLTTTKGNRPTTLSLPRGLRRRLRAYLGDRRSGPLFLAQGGKRISGRHVRRRLAFWLVKVGARHAGPHGLRRAFAMRVYRRTGDISRVQSALGHSSVASTVRYASYSAARDYCSSR